MAVNAQLDSGEATTLETVAVTAYRMLDTFNPDNKGVGPSVSGRQLDLLPQGSRSLADVERLAPRVTVIDQAGGAISVAGTNNPHNTHPFDAPSPHGRAYATRSGCKS